MVINNEIYKIEQKIQKLQQEKLALQQERNKHLTSLIDKIGISDLSDELIIGGLLYIKTIISDTSNKHHKLQEEWLAAGNKFLKKRPPKTNPTATTKTPEAQIIDNPIKEVEYEA